MKSGFLPVIIILLLVAFWAIVMQGAFDAKKNGGADWLRIINGKGKLYDKTKH